MTQSSIWSLIICLVLWTGYFQNHQVSVFNCLLAIFSCICLYLPFVPVFNRNTITPWTLDCSSQGIVGKEKLLDLKVISPEGFWLKNLAKTGLQLTFQIFRCLVKIMRSIFVFDKLIWHKLSAPVSVVLLVLFIQYLVNQFAFQKI